jgi:hypothetical protein
MSAERAALSEDCMSQDSRSDVYGDLHQGQLYYLRVASLAQQVSQQARLLHE